MHSLHGRPYQRPISAISALFQSPALTAYHHPVASLHDHHHLAAPSMTTATQQAGQYAYHHPNPCKLVDPTQNKVFVFDGRMWNEFSLENVFSGQIPCQESPGGGT